MLPKQALGRVVASSRPHKRPDQDPQGQQRMSEPLSDALMEERMDGARLMGFSEQEALRDIICQKGFFLYSERELFKRGKCHQMRQNTTS